MKDNPQSGPASSRLRLDLVLVLLLVPAPAHALYLDPATGSLILQVVAAAVLTAGLTFKRWWSRFRSFFGSLFRRSG